MSMTKVLNTSDDLRFFFQFILIDGLLEIDQHWYIYQVIHKLKKVKDLQFWFFLPGIIREEIENIF